MKGLTSVRSVVVAGVLASTALLTSGWLAPSTAGAASDPGCYTSCLPFTPTDPTDPGGPTTPVTTPTSPGGPTDPGGAGTNSGEVSSLPFTGADVAELAVVGVGAVAVGTVLLRRRKVEPEQ